MTEPRPLGLYIHIPFCRCKCAYCDFYSLPHAEEQMDAYLAALSRQLRRYAPRAADHAVDTVYFGGGTPTIFGAERLAQLLALIRREYPVAPEAEITLEGNPESARDVSALRLLREAGFDRFSLGVQATDDDMLRRLGRVHSFADVRAAVSAIRDAGFRDLSLDLMYALPGQTLADWEKTLADAIALAPEHLSCYALKVEEGTPFYQRRAALALPDDDTQAELYLAAVRILAQAGYPQYEISNFAKPAFPSRHNLRYWQLSEYLGFGPGAHSDFQGVRFGIRRDLAAYLAGEPQLSESSVISPAERAAEYLMLGLRTVHGVSAAEFEGRYGRSFAAAEQALRRCAAAGYALREGERWHLTPEGFFVSNAVISLVLEAVFPA